MGLPVKDGLLQMIEAGKQCAWCYVNLCPEYDHDRMTQLLSDDEMTGTGEVTLCPDCDAAGKSKTYYLGED